MPQNRLDIVAPFLDLEAGVDREEEEEDEHEEDGLDTFIDDRGPDQQRPWIQSLARSAFLGRDEDLDNDEFFDRILDRSRHHARRPARITDDTWEESEEDLESTIRRLPTPQDAPLMRVRCIEGMEHYALVHFNSIANDELIARLMLKSAFIRESIPGWVYIEAVMNPFLLQFLQSTPGLRPREGREGIPIEDWVDLLEMRDTQSRKRPSTGDWVRVCRGIYKGDVGFVSSMKGDGKITLLLVPRIPSSNPNIGTSSGKRKRLPLPSPTLFTTDLRDKLGETHTIEVKEDGTWSFLGRSFEHSLERKELDLNSVSLTSVLMSSDTFSKFRAALHPEIIDANFPCPSEWKFSEGEIVVIKSSGKRGVIKQMGTTSVEVDLEETEEGRMIAPWFDLRKAIVIGNFAEVTSGPSLGAKGWVIAIDDELVQISEWLEREEVGGHVFHNVLTPQEFHINWLKVIAPPITLTGQAPAAPAPLKRDNVPWIGTSVIINKPQHSLKGYSAVVKDVLHSKDTLSGMKVVVQLTHLHSAQPFAKETFDYDDVLETNSRRRLYDFSPVQNQLFKPLPRHFEQVSSRAASQNPKSSSAAQKRQLPPAAAGNSTPMPDFQYSTPAWNPSSRTPVPHPPEAGPSTSIPPPPSPLRQVPASHSLLDSRLLEKPFLAEITGGEYKGTKNLVAQVFRASSGNLSIRRAHYRTSEFLSAEHVKPKRPNPTRYNGLLLVMEGEFMGTYVRRIHHRYEDGDRPIINTAFVEVLTDGTQNLTGQQHEFKPHQLATCDELNHSNAIKDHNTNLLNNLRKEARKVRAK